MIGFAKVNKQHTINTHLLWFISNSFISYFSSVSMSVSVFQKFTRVRKRNIIYLYSDGDERNILVFIWIVYRSLRYKKKHSSTALRYIGSYKIIVFRNRHTTFLRLCIFCAYTSWTLKFIKYISYEFMSWINKYYCFLLIILIVKTKTLCVQERFKWFLMLTKTFLWKRKKHWKLKIKKNIQRQFFFKLMHKCKNIFNNLINLLFEIDFCCAHW